MQVVADTNVVAGELVLGAAGKSAAGSRHVVSKLLNSAEGVKEGVVPVVFLGTQVTINHTNPSA